MNFIDLLLIIILLLGLIKGYRKGLLNSLVGFISSIVGLIVAIKTHTYFVNWLEAKFQLTAKLMHFFEERLTLAATTSQVDMQAQSLSDPNVVWEGWQLPERIKAELVAFTQSLGENTGQLPDINVADVLYLFLARIVLNLLAIIVIWLIVNKGLCLLARFFTYLTEDTFLGSLNKLGGVCIGLLIRVLVLTIIIGLCSPLFNVAEHAEPSFFSILLMNIKEARLIPYFMSLFSLLTGHMFSIWI